MSCQSEPVDLYGDDEETGDTVVSAALDDTAAGAAEDASSELDQQFWDSRSEGSEGFVAAREVVDEDVVSAVENAVVLPADVSEIDKQMSESRPEGSEAKGEAEDNAVNAVDDAVAFPADANEHGKQASEIPADAPGMKPAAKQGKSSNVVVLDEDELDAEELQALAEVRKKGYYHGRPANGTSQAPQRLELTESQKAERDSERHAEFDDFQKKWDRFDRADWADKEERDFIGSASKNRVLQPAGCASGCSSSVEKTHAKSGVVPSNRKTLLYQCSQSPFHAFGQALREASEWWPGGLCLPSGKR